MTEPKLTPPRRYPVGTLFTVAFWWTVALMAVGPPATQEYVTSVAEHGRWLAALIVGGYIIVGGLAGLLIAWLLSGHKVDAALEAIDDKDVPVETTVDIDELISRSLATGSDNLSGDEQQALLAHVVATRVRRVRASEAVVEAQQAYARAAVAFDRARTAYGTSSRDLVRADTPAK